MHTLSQFTANTFQVVQVVGVVKFSQECFVIYSPLGFSV
jgi:hypothetical protein